MHRRKSFGYFIFILFINSIYSSIVTNICPSSSCNCTLTNDTDLDIICDSTVSLTELPTLSSNTYQLTVTQIRLMSSITSTKGPLINLPTNICSYPNLAILDLSSNNINGLLNTSELACLSSTLTSVDFSSNNINDIDINLFKSNQKLRTINLSYNNLTSMPIIDGATFVNFPSSIILMNFSYNQIMNVDFWPIFVKTGKLMTIDMSHNLISTYTNNIPVSVEQFTETPDPRYFYLNNNQITYLSDLLLEQYGACTTSVINPISTAFFIVGISNVLLTNNQLRCDCESYNLITYINDGINDFPEIYNGTALITQATCSSPPSNNGRQYLSATFTQFNNCDDYILPNITNIFCSINDDTKVTLTPPTYWPTTVTTISTTTDSPTNGITTTNLNENSSRSSTSVSWYIILGVVLGLAVLLAIGIAICYLCRDKLIPKKYRSKFLTHVRTDGTNSNNSYEAIIRNSEVSQENLMRPRRASMATSASGFDDQDLGIPRGHRSLNDGTQTNFNPIRSKPPTGRPHSTRTRHPNDNHSTSHRERRLSLSTAADVGTNTTNIVKGIPIAGVPTKGGLSIPSNNPDTSTSELSVVSIPLTPSKRAKLLPQVKSGIYVDATNENLLNTSAGALVTSQRQRRRSSMWFKKQNQNMISPLPPRPQSMVTQKTIFDYNGSFDEDLPSIPTIESLTNKPSKPIRTVPLLNISVVPAWADDNNDQT